MAKDFLQAAARQRLFFDGAMGTQLQAAGLPRGALPESWNLTHPQVVEGIHLAYLEAGCTICKANTFGANPCKLAGTGYDTAQLVQSGIAIARSALEKSGKEGFVALDLGSTGKLLAPLGDLQFEDAVAGFAAAAIAGEQAGADLVMIETINDSYELKAALLAVKENTHLPVVASVMMDTAGKLLTGAPVEAFAAMAQGLGADVLGFNCGVGPAQMLPLARRLAEACSLPLAFNPNAGLPHGDAEGNTYYDVQPAEFAATMAQLAEFSGLLGGCCGTTPAHMKAMVEACAPRPLPVPRHCEKTFVCSGMQAVELRRGAVIIGERINPTGKPRFKQALREHDIDYLLREGAAEETDGAQILDVNVGLPEIDEPELLCAAVKGLQSVVPLPLQLDTSDPTALEQALRCVNGRPLVNSVNGKQESLDAVLPLVKKYGGVLVALTLDEAGIPDTAAGRVAIAKRIVEAAAGYGIPPKDILVDVLTMAVSAGQSPAVTLDALRQVKALGVGTILGVSNVSFGLPGREGVNAAFFAMALAAGLDAAIVNPHSAKMMETWRAALALLGYDANCAGYIAACAGAPAAQPTATQGSALTLEEAVFKGLAEDAANAARAALETAEPMALVKEMLVPALDVVGKRFEQGTMFLPQLLMSAEAAQAAFEEVRLRILQSGGSAVKTDTIVLATVQGDVHDIGKNIVRVLLDNYGFRVVDLGRDVPPETVVKTVLAEKATLVGLSALMTTTVPSMAKTIALLREQCPGCKVVVGGAVLTADYAAQIGADAYAADAMATVHYAQQHFDRS